jgi:hypothetical protein
MALCWAKNGELLTNENQVFARSKEHFEEHLNEDSESEQPTRPVDLRDDEVDIDLPNCEKIEAWRDTTEKLDRKGIVSSVQERR